MRKGKMCICKCGFLSHEKGNKQRIFFTEETIVHIPAKLITEKEQGK